MNTFKFSPGDRVRCVSREDDDPVLVGDTGTVGEFSSAPYVQWDIHREGMFSVLVNHPMDTWTMTEEQLEPLV